MNERKRRHDVNYIPGVTKKVHQILHPFYERRTEKKKERKKEWM